MAQKEQLLVDEPMPDVSVQVVNYKTGNYLSKCLDGTVADLSRSSLSWNIQVLENGSGDNLEQLEKKYVSLENVAFHYSPKNVGFGSGHNLLAGKTNSRSILILNPDVEFIQPNTIARLYDTITPETPIVGPKLKNALGQTQQWDHGETYLGDPGFNFWKERFTPTNVEWVSGACLLINRNTFNKLEGFDPNLFLYLEDNDLCHRAKAEGLQVLYDPSIELMHHGSVVANKKTHMQASMAYFLEKHRQDIHTLVYWMQRANIKFFNKW